MNDLLFLSHRIPYPPDKGEKIRAWHILKHLARTHRVHLGCFADDPADMAHVDHLRTVCADVLCLPIAPRRRRLRSLLRLRPGRPLSLDYFDDPMLRHWVDGKLAAGVCRAFVYCSAMAPYLLDTSCPDPRVLDMVDVDSAKFDAYARASRFPQRLIWAREARTLARFEAIAAAAYDQTLFVSPAEAACFRARAPDATGRVLALENGVDLGYFDPAIPCATPYLPGRIHLAFTGTMNYRPNIEAMQWFVHRVLPLLPPHLHLTIVGAHPASAIRRLAAANVTVTGGVADIRPYLAHADAIIAPLQIARGVQNKLLEAMAMGCRVVASPAAHAGIDAEPGRDLLVADGADATARAIIAVTAGAHPALAGNARAAMQRRYDWATRLAPLDALFPAARPVDAALAARLLEPAG